MTMRIPKNWPADEPVPPPIPKRWFEDEKWFMQHSSELAQRYPDQWVAIFNKEVIAAGKNLAEVERVAQEKTGERDILVDLVTPTRKFYSCQS
jgi:hypothetical protein